MRIPIVLSLLTPFLVSCQKVANSTASIPCQHACSHLSMNFGAYLHYPDNDDNFRIWDAKQQEVRSACRVEPANAADVARIMEVLVAESCHFAVKGGGHSRSPGDSNAIRGVTIDLNRISHVRVSEDGRSAEVGGGATSAQTYAALEPEGLSFVGGRVGQVGVGGFTLGGGTYPFANKYGWALDNVHEYQLVLANSSIVTASAATNPDLFYALRGGANNFGIVTWFNVSTFPQGQIYISQPTWSDNQSESVLDEVYRLYTDPDLTQDLDMGHDLYFIYDQDTDRFMMSGTQRYETPMESPPVFEALDQIPTLTRTTRNATLANLTGATPELGTTRHLFDTLSILPSREVLSEGLQIFREEVSAIKSVADLAPNFICYPLPTNAINFMRREGGNALGIDQETPLFIILISTGWSNASDDTAVATMTNNVVERLRSTALRAGVAHPYLYLNYAAAGRAADVFAGYGKANAERLTSIQVAVDPDGIFSASGLWRGFMKLT